MIVRTIFSKIIAKESGWVSSSNTREHNSIIGFELFEVRVESIKVAKCSNSYPRKQKVESSRNVNCSEVPVGIRNCFFDIRVED